MSAQPSPLFLLDAGEMYAASTPAAGCASTRHSLDSAERLLACYELVRERRPEARILMFLESAGYEQLLSSWQKGGHAPLATFRSALQCVPFGCQVSAFILELASRRSSVGAEVAVVSNDVDVVVQSRLQQNRWRHLGFMFVDGDLILPGLVAGVNVAPPPQHMAVSSRNFSGSAERKQPPVPQLAADKVRKTILKARSSTHLGGLNQLRTARSASGRAPREGSQAEALPVVDERDGSYQETQMQEDSDLDGAAWKGAENIDLEGDDDAYADTQLVVECIQAPAGLGQAGQREVSGNGLLLLGDAYADTQVDMEPTTRDIAPEDPAAMEISHASEVPPHSSAAYADTQLDCALAAQRGPAPREAEASQGSEAECNQSPAPLRDGPESSLPTALTVLQHDVSATEAAGPELLSATGDVNMEKQPDDASDERRMTQNSGDSIAHSQGQESASNADQVVAPEAGPAQEHESASNADGAGTQGAARIGWQLSKNAHVIEV